MTALILVLIGMFIGWNLPQPAFAKALENKFRAWVRELTT